MRIAFFDAIGGAAGDMILGSLIDAGLDIDALKQELRKLRLPQVDIRADRVSKRHIEAVQFEVMVGGLEEHRHHHDHSRQSDGRSLREILDLIDSSGISERAKSRSRRVFQLLGEAESKVHGVEVADVHFHEIGALDSIVDVVGSAVGVEMLGLERLYASPLPVSSGQVHTQHGLYPVPAPATLEILASAGAPTRPSLVEREQVTPTGAAVLAALATFERPAMTLTRVGYGAGHADLEIPNVMRVWLGQSDNAEYERLVVMQTNVDDMTPELTAHALDRCLQAGALDALVIPVVMKKGRPGVQIELLCRREDLERLREVLLRETTSLGVRWWEADRFAMPREYRTVDTPYGPVRVKIRVGTSGAAGAAPEYEDCRRIALETGVPLQQVYRSAVRAAEADLG